MKILIISVHPDDETLGCGGTLLKHAAAGDEIDWMIVTQAHEPRWPAETIATKAREVEAVAGAYGVRRVFKLGFPTTEMETVLQNDLIDAIREVIAEARPQIVYLVHGGDIHTDHLAAFTATMCVLKPFYMHTHGVRRVLCYETLSSTEAAPALLHRLFVPNVYSEITPFLERKVEIMNLYVSEQHADPLPRGGAAIRGLAHYRGATIAAGAAEAFMLVREIV